ncbi:transcriptional regulator [Longimonas halophila]|uniref:Transcriptional regulator n=1 Tax=Longimonas halophila TaxID=1469170 RepID=A0A2H3NUW6_9BACT|nr:metalloregulator ArsR/SmtB family transcription factor [Longimonas halophila]PEN05463.1 transcriptional regulator [Longimonas halophila]
MRTKANHFATDLNKLATQAKALSHPARLQILQVIAQKERCICGEIVDDVPLAQSTVSQHLKVLKEAGLIQGTIDGPSVCYCLDPVALRLLRERFDTFWGDLIDESSATTC